MSSTTITTTTPSELAHFTATSQTIGDKRHYVLRYAVQLSVRPASVSTVGGCLLALITHDAISLYLVQGLARHASSPVTTVEKIRKVRAQAILRWRHTVRRHGVVAHLFLYTLPHNYSDTELQMHFVLTRHSVRMSHL